MRVRPAVISTSQGNVTTFTQLKQILHAGTKLSQYALVAILVLNIRNMASFGRICT